MTSPENSHRPDGPQLSEKLAKRADESPTLGKILRGETAIRRLPGEPALIARKDGVICRVSTHEIVIPGAKSDGLECVTYLSHWVPIPAESNGRWTLPPADELTILTSHGEMQYSGDSEVVGAVLDKCSVKTMKHEPLRLN